MKNKKLDPKKALKHEQKGDKLVAKGKIEKALKEYRQSEMLNPERAEIYEKLIGTQNQLTKEMNQEDFSELMGWTMRQQELQNPEIAQVYETLTTEYQDVQKLLNQLMMAEDEVAEKKTIEKILNYKEKANLPTLNFLLSIKAASRGHS